MEQIYTAIQAAADQNANAFRDAIGDVLATKINDALELKRIEIASNMFNNHSEDTSEQETVSDEDV